MPLVRYFIPASYADRHNTTSSIGSKPVHRTANTRRSTIEDMGIDHRGLDVAMTQEFLYRSNIVAAFEQVSGKGMSEGVASGPLR